MCFQIAAATSTLRKNTSKTPGLYSWIIQPEKILVSDRGMLMKLQVLYLLPLLIQWSLDTTRLFIVLYAGKKKANLLFEVCEDMLSLIQEAS